MADKVYIETLPHTYCGLDLGLPLDAEVRKALEGFHKIEILRLLDEGQSRLDEGEDVNAPSNFSPARPQLPADSRVENELADRLGDDVVTGEQVVTDNYDEWSRDELYAEAKGERGLTGLSKLDKDALVAVLRKYDREHPDV